LYPSYYKEYRSWKSQETQKKLSFRKIQERTKKARKTHHESPCAHKHFDVFLNPIPRFPNSFHELFFLPLDVFKESIKISIFIIIVQ